MPSNVTQDDPVRSAKSWVVEGMDFFHRVISSGFFFPLKVGVQDYMLPSSSGVDVS